MPKKSQCNYKVKPGIELLHTIFRFELNEHFIIIKVMNLTPASI